MNNLVDSLHRQLLKRRENLSYLQEQAAQYGAIDVPLWLKNKIDAENGSIAKLEENIQELEKSAFSTIHTTSPAASTTNAFSKSWIIIAVAFVALIGIYYVYILAKSSSQGTAFIPIAPDSTNNVATPTEQPTVVASASSTAAATSTKI